VRIISENGKKTEAPKSPPINPNMLKYERLTGKHAIWKGVITKGYKKWKNGEKPYYLNQKRISLYVPEAIKEEWKIYAKQNNYTTISNLIRESVDSLIKNRPYGKPIYSDIFKMHTHNIMQDLSLVSAYSELMIDKYEDKLDDKAIDMLKAIKKQIFLIRDSIDRFRKDFIDQNEKDERDQYDILLIEDDKKTIRLLISFFESNEISCKAVTSGLIGLNELGTYAPKLILLDIILPDISGYEVLSRIRANSRLKDVPVYLLTAIPRSDVENYLKTHDLKPTGAIYKPFVFTDFDIIFNYLK